MELRQTFLTLKLNFANKEEKTEVRKRFTRAFHSIQSNTELR